MCEEFYLISLTVKDQEVMVENPERVFPVPVGEVNKMLSSMLTFFNISFW